MCLRIRLNGYNHEPLKASDNITCYKIVLRTGVWYKTPFMETRLSWTVMLGLKKFKANDKSWKEIGVIHRTLDFIGEEYLDVTDGVIHTMELASEAQKFAKYISSLHLEHVEVWECEIDKGEEYIHGLDGNGFSCRGSKSIRFKKKICEY